MKKIFTILLLFSLECAVAQTACDKKALSAMEKEFEQADKKGKAITYAYADLSFQIAECYRLKNDGASLQWYAKHLVVCKSAFTTCTKENISACNRTMGQAGISSYYTGRYEDAIQYLEKALSYFKDPDLNYYLGRAHMAIGDYQVALVEFTNFKKSATDQRDVAILIQNCEDNLK